MRIALISLTDEASPRHGLIYLASYLREKGNYNDIKIFEYFQHDIFSELKRFKPDIIGIGAMTVEYMRAKRFAKLSNEKFLGIPILLGGVHISMLQNSFDPLFDVGVVGEGEISFLELVNLYNQKGKFFHEDLKKIGSLVYYHNGTLIQTKLRSILPDLSLLPIPDYDHFLSKVHTSKKRMFAGGYGREMSILSSRGCPYKCVFCSTSNFWQKFRFRPYEQVIDEMTKLYHDYKIRYISFWDDLFTANNERMKKIRDGLKERGILDDLNLAVQSRANIVTREQLDILKSLNVDFVGFGFESGSDKYLRYLKANSVTLKDNIRAVNLTKHYGFTTQGSLIFGGPGETIQDMNATIKFIKFCKKKRVEYLWSFVMTPFPGTPMWEIAKQRNKVSDNMNFDLLSHQNIDNPLMLDSDISVNTFKKIFLKARKELNYSKYIIIKRNLFRDPVGSLMDFVSKPTHYLGVLFQLTTKYGNPNSNLIGNKYNSF